VIGFPLIIAIHLAFSSGLLTGATASPSRNSPSAMPTTQPMVTIGGEHSERETTRVSLGPVAHGLRLSLTPSAATFAIGKPMVVSLWINSLGDRDRLVCFPSFRYHLKFIVTSQDGIQLPETSPSERYGSIIRFNHCDLEPYKQWRYDVPVNEFASITRPGLYTVRATLDVQTNDPAARDLTLQSNTIKLTVTP
jgi:hypothetical protein